MGAFELGCCVEELRETQSFQLKQLQERLRLYQCGKHKRWLPSSSSGREKRQEMTQEDDEEDILLDTVTSAPADDEDPPIAVTKIFYCSRTHSQLDQVLNEFLRSEWSKEFHCGILGGRRSLCINPR